MRVRAWICNALSGSVAGEVQLDGGTLTSCLGGGDLSTSIVVGIYTTRGGDDLDWAALRTVNGYARGGRWSLVATAGDQLLGEWLILKTQAGLADDSIQITGMEWDGYPALRSLNDNYELQNVDMLQIAKTLWTDAYMSYQESRLQVQVPDLTSGVLRSVSHKSHTAYYSDALDEIADSDPGFEWKLRSTPSWFGGALASVSRAVVVGSPILDTQGLVTAYHYGPGSRAGAVLDVSGGTDGSKYAQSVYGWGAGEGGKQKWVGLSDSTLTNQGWPVMTKNVTFNGVSDAATLSVLTQQALSEAQRIDTAYTVELQLDRLDALPIVGGVVHVVCAPTQTFPDGLDVQMRVGKVSYQLDGMEARSATVTIA